MKGWLRRVRGAVGMGLSWAVGWALVGLGIELIHNVWPNPVGALVDIWPAVLAYPAFLGGLVFSTVLGIAGRRRSFGELSLSRFAAWGAFGGLLLGLFPAALVAMGTATVAEGVAVVGALTLLSAASASGSLALARMAEGEDSSRTAAELPAGDRS
ncbi:MAG: hypothetical protein OEZ65_05680 [Gemmatimonadota bacterium]|nr:hypothetical protein [Gemmatimonadota bacterium]MDH5759061.1 hypothetical protein [Gemmatimonadota bacterium]